MHKSPAKVAMAASWPRETQQQPHTDQHQGGIVLDLVGSTTAVIVSEPPAFAIDPPMHESPAK